MDNVFCICFRTLLVLVILFFVTKLLGKKQVSQLSLFDYVVGITIGSIAADISLDLEKDLIAGIVSVFLYGIIWIYINGRSRACLIENQAVILTKKREFYESILLL